MKNLSVTPLLLCLATAASAEMPADKLKRAQTILEKAEKIRAPNEGKSFVTLTSENPKKQ